MRIADAYSDLMRMGIPIVTTREAAARWEAERGTAGRRLRSLESAGLMLRLRRGLWAMDPDIDPFVVPPYLTAPLPAYVSLWSALAHHGLIEQIPRRISVASLDRPRRIPTSVGVFEVHRLSPELIGGFTGTAATGYLATAEKALFDVVYVRAATGSHAYFPELTLPPEFGGAKAMSWAERIAGKRLRTLVSRRLDEILGRAERLATG